MGDIVRFEIDGKKCQADAGAMLIDAAGENGVYIPFLCNMPGFKPRGACRVCNVKVNGKLATACTTRVAEGMKVENDTDELNGMRKIILEVLFVEGNHFCPTCEKSGNCELQALAYRFRIMAPRFPYLYPERRVEADSPKLFLDRNRCILCKRCIRAVKDGRGRSLFAFLKRGRHTEIALDRELAASLTDDGAQKAMDVCPVGAILRKRKGFDVPVGRRKWDQQPIGSDIEKKS